MSKIYKDNKFACNIIFLTLFFFVMWWTLIKLLNVESIMTADDIASILFSNYGDGLTGKLKNIIQNEPTNVPLFYLLIGAWIKLFGFKACVMRILPMLIGALNILVFAYIGKKALNEKCGYLMAILAGCSIQLIPASFQIRAYSLVVLFSALSFLVWMSRDGKKKNEILFAVVLLVTSFSHFFGVLVCCALFSVDIFLVIVKKQKMKSLASYLIYIILFSPYLIMAYLNAMNMWGTFWPPIPQFRDIIYLLNDLMPTRYIAIYIFIGVFAAYILMLFNKRKLNIFDDKFRVEIFACFWCVFAIIFVAFVYSKLINPTSSVWVTRYFYVLLPFIYLIIVYGMKYLIEKINTDCSKESIQNFWIVVLFITCIINSDIYLSEEPGRITWHGSDFEKTTETLMEQPDIYDNDTLVYYIYPEQYEMGIEIYMTHNGEKNMPNFINSPEEFSEIEIEKYSKVYVIDIIDAIPEDIQAYLDTNYSRLDFTEQNVSNLYKYVK